MPIAEQKIALERWYHDSKPWHQHECWHLPAANAALR